MKEKRILILTAVLILFVLVSGSGSAATLHVNQGKDTGEYGSLQEAVNAAAEGDIIVVKEGLYRENIVVNKSLEIISESPHPGKTVITALDPEIPIFHVTSDSVKISGFALKGANSTYGIYLDGVSENNINNNYVSENWRSILLRDSHGNSLENNRLSKNDNGIWLENSEKNLIKDNRAESNKHYGFYLNASENNTLQNNVATRGAVGVYIGNSPGCQVYDSKTSNNFYGIFLMGSGESLLENNTANSNEMYGIYLGNSNGCTLIGNTANSNHWGIYLDSSLNTLQNNKMTCNSRNFGAYTYHYRGEMNNSIDTSNTVDGKSIYYLVGVSNWTLDSDSNAGVVYCIDCENITLRDLVLENSSFGIYLYNTRSSLLEGNSISNCEHAVYLGDCSMTVLRGNAANSNEGNAFILSSCRNCLVEVNNASDNMAGIWLCDESRDNILKGNKIDSSSWCCIDLGDASCNNTIEGNVLSEAYEGIYLYGASEWNTLSNNTITASFYGLYTEGCGNNTISGNNISGNDIGISLSMDWIDVAGSNNNIIYNNYLNNSKNAEDYGTNTWNISRTESRNIVGGPYLGGNFWASPEGDGFSETAPDGDGDMIADLPYYIAEINYDYLPLVSGKPLEEAGIENGNKCDEVRRALKDLQAVFPVSAGDFCEQEKETLGTVIIGTVEGDSHTYGKDSIAAAFEENGFEIINLGADISAERFVAVAKEKEADFVFSSASMSTTMIHQIQIEEQLKAAGIRDKVRTGVGGSQVTQAWANQIGAEMYATGPEDAVLKVKSAILNSNIPETHIASDKSTSCGDCHG